jgi:hydrogenase maturation protease
LIEAGNEKAGARDSETQGLLDFGDDGSQVTESAVEGEQKTLVLGLGNIIMGDEGVGVHVVRALEKHELPRDVKCLDGGTGGFVLLEPLQNADRIILIDAAADRNPPGTVTRTTPRFAQDYPPSLTAHDIGVKDLLDAFYLQDGSREVILYAVAIDPQQPISMELSEECAHAAQMAEIEILAEIGAATLHA